MPRDGSGVYSPPPGTTAAPNETITSAMWNANRDDVAAALNGPIPLGSGGTGATSASTARSALGLVKQESTSDSTADRVLMTGAFGLGGNALAATGSDFNLITKTGVYQGANGTVANVPSTGSYTLFHNEMNATAATQIAIRFGSSNTVYFRSRDTTWTTWQLLISRTESGTNSNGLYIKRSDGRIECRQSVTFTEAVDTAFAGGYRSSARTWTFPTAFTGVPTVMLSVEDAFGVVMTSPTTTTQAFYAVTSIAALTSASRTVNLLAIGS